MEEFQLFLRMLLSILFLSTSVSKFRKIEEHIVIIKEYRIIPLRWSRGLGWFEVMCEFAVGFCLLVGFWIDVTFMTAALLLFIYSVAVSVNLLRGRDFISCGCGGIAGDQALSWKLVLRNIFLIAVVFWLFLFGASLGRITNVFSHPESFFSFRVTFIIIMSAIVTLIGTLIVQFIKMNQSMNNLLNEGRIE